MNCCSIDASTSAAGPVPGAAPTSMPPDVTSAVPTGAADGAINGASGGATSSLGGGGTAVAGAAAAVGPDQLVPVLQQLVAALQQLVAVLQPMTQQAGAGQAAGALGAPSAAPTPAPAGPAATAPATAPAPAATTGGGGSVDVAKWVKGDVDGLDQELLTRLAKVGERIGTPLDIVSGFRSREEQQKLYDAYKAGRGNLAAKPGTSNHESGNAADVNVGGASLANNAEAKRAALEPGLHFPVPGEPWHVEVK